MLVQQLSLPLVPQLVIPAPPGAQLGGSTVPPSVPTQTPPEQVWLDVHATGLPHCPAELHVCTPSPEHCVALGVQTAASSPASLPPDPSPPASIAASVPESAVPESLTATSSPVMASVAEPSGAVEFWPPSVGESPAPVSEMLASPLPASPCTPKPSPAFASTAELASPTRRSSNPQMSAHAQTQDETASAQIADHAGMRFTTR